MASSSGGLFRVLYLSTCISVFLFSCFTVFVNFKFCIVNLGRKKVKKAEKEAVIVPGQWPLSQHVTYTVCTTRIRFHFQLILRRIYYLSSIIIVLILVMLMPDDNDNNERYTFCTIGRRRNVQLETCGLKRDKMLQPIFIM